MHELHGLLAVGESCLLRTFPDLTWKLAAMVSYSTHTVLSPTFVVLGPGRHTHTQAHTRREGAITTIGSLYGIVTLIKRQEV
jgi:hypothetical protein